MEAPPLRLSVMTNVVVEIVRLIYVVKIFNSVRRYTELFNCYCHSISGASFSTCDVACPRNTVVTEVRSLESLKGPDQTSYITQCMLQQLDMIPFISVIFCVLLIAISFFTFQIIIIITPAIVFPSCHSFFVPICDLNSSFTTS